MCIIHVRVNTPYVLACKGHAWACALCSSMPAGAWSSLFTYNLMSSHVSCQACKQPQASRFIAALDLCG
jgi:hypothetical protein